jgi:hypothetical protein
VLLRQGSSSSEGAEAAGFARLANAGKSTVWRILNENEIKPHKIRYYLEKRDPEFDRKMQEVLMVYRDVSINQELGRRWIYCASLSSVLKKDIANSLDRRGFVREGGIRLSAASGGRWTARRHIFKDMHNSICRYFGCQIKIPENLCRQGIECSEG